MSDSDDSAMPLTQAPSRSEYSSRVQCVVSVCHSGGCPGRSCVSLEVPLHERPARSPAAAAEAVVSLKKALAP
jgi:hypothetical protein